MRSLMNGVHRDESGQHLKGKLHKINVDLENVTLENVLTVTF